MACTGSISSTLAGGVADVAPGEAFRTTRQAHSSRINAGGMRNDVGVSVVAHRKLWIAALRSDDWVATMADDQKDGSGMTVCNATGLAQPVEPLAAQWLRVRTRLAGELGDAEIRHWLRQVNIGDLIDGELTITLPSRFLRDWVRTQHRDRLTALWQRENSLVRRLDIRIAGGEPAGRAEPLDAEPSRPAHAPQLRASEARSPEPRTEQASPLDPRFSFDSFVVGKPNEFAYACARRVAEAPASPGFNPLFLYGPVGIGKTHLMHAIGNEVLARRPDSAIAYMSAEKFMYRFIAALRAQQQIEFKDQLRGADVLMVDDLQFLIGKDNTQEEFFHTFNAVVEAGKQIVVSSDQSPSDLSGLEDRLRTRLGCGMVADLHATTFELRVSILQSKAERTGVAVPPKVLEFLAHKITANVRELEGALNRLIAHANLFDRPITLDTTIEVLHDMLKAHDRRVTIDEIQRRVAEHYKLRVSDMTSARRARQVARPRQVAMYLSKHLTSRSLPEIGKKFGGRDHTTVLHACNKVAELIGLDAEFADNVDLLRSMLES